MWLHRPSQTLVCVPFVLSLSTFLTSSSFTVVDENHNFLKILVHNYTSGTSRCLFSFRSVLPFYLFFRNFFVFTFCIPIFLPNFFVSSCFYIHYPPYHLWISVFVFKERFRSYCMKSPCRLDSQTLWLLLLVIKGVWNVYFPWYN